MFTFLLISTFVVLMPALTIQCEFRINELNAENAGEDKWEFIEIIKISCSIETIGNLNNYILIIIKEFESSFGKPSIVFSADLNGQNVPSGSQYFVVGSVSDKNNQHLSFLNDQVMYKRKYTRTPMQLDLGIKEKFEAYSLLDVIKNGNKFTMGLLLLKFVSYEDIQQKPNFLLKFARSKNSNSYATQPIEVTSQFENIIRNTVVDMVLFSRRAFYNDCTFFKRLSARISESKVLNIATEWDVDGDDASSNRCPTSPEELTELFLFSKFKLGRPTPNEANDCSGPIFILHEHLDTILEQLSGSQSAPITSNFRRSLISTPTACLPSTRVTDYTKLTTSSVSKIRDCAIRRSRNKSPVADICPCTDKSTDETEDALRDIQSVLHKEIAFPTSTSLLGICKKPRLESEDPVSYVKSWEDTSFFQEDWLQKINRYQSHFVASTIFSKENKVWLQYIFNENQPTMSTFRCRFCYEYVKTKQIAQQNTPSLASELGYYVAQYHTMYKKLTTHSQSGIHVQAVLDLKEKYATLMKQCANTIDHRHHLLLNADVEPTIKMIRTIYTETKLNIPFDSHKHIVYLQQTNGINLGSHHFERTSAKRMVESISSKMHATLLNHLRNMNHPITLIVDTSSDSTNRNFLFIFIRSIEQNTPVTYFYRSIQLKTETADNLYNVLIATFREDKWYATVLQNLRAFSSDGAPTMQGSKGGLAKLLNGISHHNFYNVHCLAHRLELAVGHAIKEVHGINNIFETFINSLYSFYYNKSFKRKQSLVDTSESLGEIFHELSNVHGIRWVASETQALQKILINYRALLNNMVFLSKSGDEFGNEVPQKAFTFEKTLSNIRFLTTLLFSIDVLNVLKENSLQFQKSSSSIIGKEKYKIKMMEQLENLKTVEGTFLNKFLKEIKCFKLMHWTSCNVEDLDTCDVHWNIGNEQLLLKQPPAQRVINPNQYNILSRFRHSLIDSLKKEIDAYFPEGSLQIFDVLDPVNMPMQVNNIPSYCLQIKPLAKRFQFSEDLIKNQLCDMTTEFIVNHLEQYCLLKQQNDPVKFWNVFLNNEMITWPKELKELLHIVLIVPLGSSDVERGFSVLHSVNIKSRNRLTAKHLEDIVRIKINGPPIEKFDPIPYTLHWLASGHIKADDSRKTKDIATTEAESKSILF